jgi:tetratricopeptide (TPR) repeat protein
MMERGRALRPLQDAAPAISRLETYESPAELAEALRATWHAVDASLRLLLRGDPGVPDELRLKVMSRAELNHDALITELRRRDVISLQLAGRVHELMQAAARAESGVPRAADADAAAGTVDLLRRELETASAAAAVESPASRTERTTRAAGDSEERESEAGDVAADPPGLRRLARGPALLIGSTLLLVVAAVVMLLLFARPDDMGPGVEAFRAGNMGTAEQHFRAALARDSENVTARLYLGRILRAQGRQQEAAEMLRAAANIAPRDPAVRRELGYLLIDLDRAPQAAQQFRQAVELDPEEPLGWVGLHEALVRADDPAAAAEVLRRAPPSAQAMIRSRQQ